jgi:hypothetical protein
MGNHVVGGFTHQNVAWMLVYISVGQFLIFLGIAKFGYYNVLKDLTQFLFENLFKSFKNLGKVSKNCKK